MKAKHHYPVTIVCSMPKVAESQGLSFGIKLGTFKPYYSLLRGYFTSVSQEDSWFLTTV
jgi:hypothetical protein